MLPLLLALLCAPPEPRTVTAVRRVSPAQAWVTVEDDPDQVWLVWRDGDGVEPRIVWHLDPRVELTLADIHPGVRVRISGASESSSVATRVEIICLGPLSLAAAVEEFVADSCGDRPWTGLTAGEVATINALGSASWLVRDAVTRSLRERGPAALGLLMRARRSRDAEVRARAEGLLCALGR